MIHVLYGVDSYSRHEAVAEIVTRTDTDGMLATNTTRLDGRRLTLPDLLMVCDAAPFLGAHRLVHVTGLLARAGSERPARGRRSSKAAPAGGSPPDQDDGWLALAAYAARMPPSTVLVLEDGDVRATNALLVALGPHAKVREFGRMSARMVSSWISERARRRGVLFEGSALRLLSESVPVDVADDGQWHALWALAGDIEKLSLYAKGEKISEQEVQRLAPAAAESRIFVLSDAVAERRGGEALVALEELLQSGRPAPVLLAALAGRCRQLLLIRDLLDQSVPPREIAARLGIRSEWQFDRLYDQARRNRLPQLEAAFQRIIQADRSIKHGRSDETTALETLVADLAGV